MDEKLQIIKYWIMKLQIVQNKIFEVRGYWGMLDFHFAELYNVKTKVFWKWARIKYLKKDKENCSNLYGAWIQRFERIWERCSASL